MGVRVTLEVFVTRSLRVLQIGRQRLEPTEQVDLNRRVVPFVDGDRRGRVGHMTEHDPRLDAELLDDTLDPRCYVHELGSGVGTHLNVWHGLTIASDCPLAYSGPVSAIFERMTAAGHEQVVFVSDASSGLRAIIAIHSTALGPALGGVRFWTYASDDAALTDALRLSEAMTYKAAAAGLNQGGGKCVVLIDPQRPRQEPALRALGRAIDELGGRYIAAEDVGATEEDMRLLALETPWVTGVPILLGGSGDPSPTTALGVLHGMRAACARAFGTPELTGRRVAIQGAGHVGSCLARLLVEAGAQVAVSDLRTASVQSLVSELGVEPVASDAILTSECDVLAPCALGGAIGPETIGSLRCRVIAGAANNQLVSREDCVAVEARGIVFAPDFVINAGGIINIAEEFRGYDRARAEEVTRSIEQTTERIFALADAAGISSAEAAVRYARERIELVGSLRRRYRPGAPVAWAPGEPLRPWRR